MHYSGSSALATPVSVGVNRKVDRQAKQTSLLFFSLAGQGCRKAQETFCARTNQSITAWVVWRRKKWSKKATDNPACQVGVCLLLACLTSQKHASVSQGLICTDNSTCCHTDIEVAHQTFYLTQSQYTDNGLTSPSADPIMPGAWQGSHWSAKFLSYWYDSTWKNPVASGIRTPDLPLPRRTPQPLASKAVWGWGGVSSTRTSPLFWS